MERIYLVSTEHLEEGLWFRDEDDFIVGMNHVAVGLHYSKVKVLAFILMSNHLHFVLIGVREEVESFVQGIKVRYSLYFNKKYRQKELLRRNAVHIQEVDDSPDSVRRAIAYVHMNSVSANICLYTNQYKWGTGDVFFSESKCSGKRIGDFSKRKLMNTLHCGGVDLPENWLIGPEGYILPQCYVNVEYVENLYGTPARMAYFQNNSSKARRRLETSELLPSFKDQVILSAMPDIYRSMFGKVQFNELSREEKGECLRQVRYRFSSDVKQVARVCGITYSEAANLLDKP